MASRWITGAHIIQLIDFNFFKNGINTNQFAEKGKEKIFINVNIVTENLQKLFQIFIKIPYINMNKSVNIEKKIWNLKLNIRIDNLINFFVNTVITIHLIKKSKGKIMKKIYAQIDKKVKKMNKKFGRII